MWVLDRRNLRLSIISNPLWGFSNHKRYSQILCGLSSNHVRYPQILCGPWSCDSRFYLVIPLHILYYAGVSIMPPRVLASAVLASAVLASGQNPAGAITQIMRSLVVQASKFTTTGKQRDISIPSHKQCSVSDLKSKPTWEEIKKWM